MSFYISASKEKFGEHVCVPTLVGTGVLWRLHRPLGPRAGYGLWQLQADSTPLYLRIIR